jgi:hypothetical protein
VRFLVPALAMVEPVRCRLEIGRARLRNAEGREIGVVGLRANSLSACISPVRVETRGAVTIDAGGDRAVLEMVWAVLAFSGGLRSPRAD